MASNNVGKLPAAKGKRKRGVILLLVVSLLALFLLIGVTYAILATNYFQTTKIEVRKDEYGDLPEKEFDLVLGQLLYDTFARSSLRHHSFLADLYGSDTVYNTDADGNTANNTKVFSTAAPNGFLWGGQAYGFQVLPTALQSQGGPLSDTIDYYAGRVLTFTQGPAANYSARILQYDPTLAGGPQFIIELDYSAHESVGAPLFENHFAINGAPFNGAGAGYDINTYNMDAVIGDIRDYASLTTTPTGDLAALLPHFNGFDPTYGRVYMNAGTSAQSLDLFAAGGADETWDAVDYQNMYLAMVPPAAAIDPTLPILPSFHRPELVGYWINYIINTILVPASVTDPANQATVMAQPYGADGVRGTPDDDTPVPIADLPLEQRDRIYHLTRGSIFRPMPWDHPNFTGSNLAFDGGSLNYQQLFNNLSNLNGRLWDVDNDNDGVPDSIWVDPGLPVVTSPDGKRYKRLVAILVQDLDGRIDLNAHGNLRQLVGNHRATTPINLGLAVNQNLPRGIGFGPAEVDFLNTFSATPLIPTAPEVTAYTNLLTARYASYIPGDSVPGIPNVRDGLNIVKHHGVPNDFSGQLSWYASPPDVWGRSAYALDYGGQPVSNYSGDNVEMLDNPYEISLSGELNNADSPYTLVEIERLLRYHDPDAQHLPCRPLQPGVAGPVLAVNLPGVIGTDHLYRQRIAGRGSHLPVPGTVAPAVAPASSPIGRNTLGVGGSTILDLYVRRLSAGGSTNVAQDFYNIVPWELRQGGKFNLNRWLGDGFDSTAAPGDFVSDDPVEGFAGEQAWSNDNSTAARGPTPLAPGNFPGTIAHHTNGVDVNNFMGPPGAPDGTDRMMARHLFARHLFCLAMLFFDQNGFAAPAPQEMTLSPAQHRELFIRRIAQWAINVVDFRDSDGIMTAFEYDANPWNGWSVDGDPATVGDRNSPDITNNTIPTGGLVWGTEAPDLLITESLAFHAKHVKDSTQDDNEGAEIGSNMGDDNDMDQFRVPEGSLFLELYCPRAYRWQGAPANQTANQKPRLPPELYDYSNPNNPRLDLGRVSPSAGGWPTWRLAISPLTYGDADLTAWKPGQMSVTNPESASFETAPSSVSLLATSPMGQLPIERYVWFTTAGNAPAAATAFGNNSFYFNDTGNLLGSTPFLQPGQYAIVGPRPTTYTGSLDPSDPDAAMPVGEWGDYSQQRFDLTATGMQVVDLAGAPIMTPPVRNAVPIVVDTGPITPAGWTDPLMYLLPRTVGLNISEPMPLVSYYPEPVLTAAPAAGVPRDVYDDPAMPANLLPDEPFDGRDVPQFPLGDRNMGHSGTYDDCSTVFLQRLANPNLPFNVLSNPYITVDWASIDLTVFNGDDYTRSAADMPVEPEDDPAQRPNGGNFRWTTRKRGFPQGGPAQANPWPPFTVFPPASMNGASMAYFNFELSTTEATLGYINNTIALPAPPTGAPPPPPNVPTYLGEPIDAANQPAPFPWIVHHDRPLASPFELLQVPSSAPSRLCSEFTPGFNFGSQPIDSLFTNSRDENLRAPFAHLINFFHSDSQPSDSPQLHRLLDYVDVPSPYTGTERWYNPQEFSLPPLPAPRIHLYNPPFNSVSRFRDPGRININTIFDAEVWNAAVAQFPGMDSNATPTFLSKLNRSRRAFTAPGGNPLSPVDASSPTANPIPTLFGNPFRPSDAADLMPNLTIGGVPMRRQSPVEATFLRPDPDAPIAGVSVTPPLFDQRANNLVADNFRNTDRNAYFRYQALQKLGNTFTTHSNVFAVWMTIGYFEVEDNVQGGVTVVNAAHPDGLRLGPEIGADSGEIRRHRFFSIIDRSVPVGYVHGQKLNTDNCVQLRRMIE